MRPTSSPSTEATASPSTATKNSSPSSPSRVTSVPAGTDRGSAIAAMRSISSSLQPEKSHTSRSSSMRCSRSTTSLIELWSTRQTDVGPDPRGRARRRAFPDEHATEHHRRESGEHVGEGVVRRAGERERAGRLGSRHGDTVLSSHPEPRTVSRCWPGFVPTGMVMLPAKLPPPSLGTVPTCPPSNRTLSVSPGVHPEPRKATSSPTSTFGWLTTTSPLGGYCAGATIASAANGGRSRSPAAAAAVAEAQPAAAATRAGDRWARRSASTLSRKTLPATQRFANSSSRVRIFGTLS